MEQLPKMINCRLKDDEDRDLKEMLGKANDKTARIKELLRKGLEVEVQKVKEVKPVTKGVTYYYHKDIKVAKPLILVP